MISISKTKYLRECSYCNKGINEGYVWGNGEAYGCDNCYTRHLIEWSIALAERDSFVNCDDKEEYINEVTDQLYVNWLEDEEEEMKEDILDMLNKFYDAYREDYLQMFGNETNNYLEIDSDLELHIEQEDKHHVFVSLFYLAQKYEWAE